MIKRNHQLIVLNQSIAFKNLNLEFVDFTDNVLLAAGLENEDAILGKRDDADFPWSIYADEYQRHDRDALNGIYYGTITSFRGIDPDTEGAVFCTRTRCNLEDGTIGVLIHVVPLFDSNLIELVHLLKKSEPSNLHTSYFVGKNPTEIQLTNKESECLFYLLRGKPSKFIAKFMNISVRTVDFHLDNLKTKFDCHNKSELIYVAIQKGYLSIIPQTIPAKNINFILKEKP